MLSRRFTPEVCLFCSGLYFLFSIAQGYALLRGDRYLLWLLWAFCNKNQHFFFDDSFVSMRVINVTFFRSEKQ